jgi:hypothetical protein
MRGTIKEPDGKEIRMIMELVQYSVSIICHDVGLRYNSLAAQHIHGDEEADPVGNKRLILQRIKKRYPNPVTGE